MSRITIAGLSAPRTFLARFKSSDVSAEITDGVTTVEVTVPGLEGNKANSILRTSLGDRHDMLEEIEAQANLERSMTPAECVRRTAQWEGEEGARVFTFRTSLAKGSRTHRVPEKDLPDFMDTLAERFDAVEAQVEALTVENEG